MHDDATDNTTSTSTDAASPDDDQRLAEEIQALLGDRTVATAESCTAGRIAERFACVTSASEFLRGGLVAYQEEVKREMLGVTATSVLSEQSASEMAAGVCRLLGADVAVATTGVAGDEPQDGVAPGTVFIATAVDGRITARRYRWDGEPVYVCDQATHQALVDLAGDLR